MEITGQVSHILPLEKGVGKTSGKEWSKQTAVITYGDQYPKSMAFDMFGDRIKDLKVGDTITVKFDVDSREYNGKWYTNISAWAVEVGQTRAPIGENDPIGQNAMPPEPADESLPF